MTSFIHKKITYEYLEQLKSNQNLCISDSETPGLRLRFYSTTKTKTFYFWFRTKTTKKSYNIRIGQYPEVKLMEARDIANEFRTMTRRGENPVEQLRLKEKKFQAEEEKRIKFKVVLQKYLDEYAIVYKKPKTYKTDLSTANNYLFPKLGNLLINEVNISNINSLVSEVGKKSKSQANKCKALISHFLNWCEDMRIREVNTNPCRRVRKFILQGKDRVLSIEEYLRFFAACNKGEKLGQYSPYVFDLFRFLAFCGCRPSEVRLLKFSEVDFDYSMLRLKDSKTGKRTVPLGKEALDMLRNLYNKLYKGNSEDYVFPASIRKGTPLLDLRRPWNYIRKEAKLEGVTPHDLRHSFATFASTIGENTAIVSKILGHSNITTTENYIHINNIAGVKSANTITGALKAVLSQGDHKSGEYIKKANNKKQEVINTGKLTQDYIKIYFQQRFQNVENIDKTAVQYGIYTQYIKSYARITYLEIVEKDDIEELYNQIKNLSPTDADSSIIVLYDFFNWCELNKYRTKNTNPCSDLIENIPDIQTDFLTNSINMYPKECRAAQF